jgi:NDP-sugar pyrophosphorylase family protein
MSRRAVILAGGRGSRLRPYTVVLPKPLMPIGEYPILEVILRQLMRFDFRRVTLAVSHQANLIKAFCGDGSQWGLSIDYSLEDKPLSTIAPLRLIPDLPENFLLMNGDVLADLDFAEFYCRHVDERRLFTIAASQRQHIVDYGVLRIDSANQLTGFDEKPSVEYLVSMGIYVVHRSVLDRIPPETKYGFDDLMLAMLAAKERVHVQTHRGFWRDIGRPDDYLQAVDEFETIGPRLLGDA